MQTIDTGYRPEGALGAWYAGQNTANAQDMNDEDLSKLFLQNQQLQQTYTQAQQMNPLDVIAKLQTNDIGAYDSALARAKQSSPSYIPMSLMGQEGQMQSQATAADIGKALAPFKIASEKGQLENEQGKQGVLWTMQDIDKQLAQGGGTDEQGNVVPFNPNQIGFMVNKRKQLEEQLKSTPEFAQKKELTDDKTAAAIEAANVRAQAMVDAANLRAAATSSAKPPKTAQEAVVRDIARREADGEIDHVQAQQERAAVLAAQQQANRTPVSTVGTMPNGKTGIVQEEKVPAYVAPTGGTRAETKEINGVTYVKVPGGWKKQ